MGRVVVLIILALLIWALLRGLFRAQVRRSEGEMRVRTEDMVSCARCGVNLPRSEAREDQGKFYCVNNPHCKSA